MNGRHRAADRGVTTDPVDDVQVRRTSQDEYVPRHAAPEESNVLIFSVWRETDAHVQ